MSFAGCVVQVALRALALALAALVAACAAPPRRDADHAAIAAQSLRESQLRQQPRWALRGRIAVSDAHDGGSGRIDWSQDGDRYRIEIRAPVSRRTWRLSGADGRAVLEGLEQGTQRAADAETLLREHVGWTVPVEDLVAWVRGARGQGHAELEFDAENRPVRLQQGGWVVDYRDWTEHTPPLPRRLFARRGEQRVRLVVERWDADASPH